MMDRDAWRDWLTRGRVLTLSLLLLALVVAAVGARPTWRAIKTWRAHRFAAEGELFAEKGQWDQALRKARQAIQLSATDARSQRLMARALTRFGHDQAVAYWLELLKSPASTPRDREEAIAAALRTRAWDTVREQLQIALARPPVSPVVYRLASDYYTAHADFKQGIHFARQALQAAPRDGTNILFTAQRLLLARAAAETAEARALLESHAAEPVLTGVEALVLLATQFTNSPAQMDGLIARLRAHPARTLPHEFLALDLEWRLRPDTWEKLVADAGARYAGGGDEALLHLCRWLNRHTQYARVLDHLPLTRALQNQELYLVYLDALAGLRRWAEVETALDTLGAPLDQFYLTLYKVRAQLEQGRADAANMNWALAHNRAADNPEHVLYLAQYAERIGAFTEALRAYRRAADLLPTHRPTLLALLRLTERHGTTRDVRDVLALLVERFPEDTSAQNDHAYFNLLLGDNIEPARQTAELLVQSQPDMLAFRMTLALACLRLNRPADAARLIVPVKVDWNQVNPGWRAVLAATLQATGETTAAAQITATLAPDSLRPEERALLPPAR